MILLLSPSVALAKEGGDPNAPCFEHFLPWIHKLMLAYPEIAETKEASKSIPSRSLPHYYIKKLN